MPAGFFYAFAALRDACPCFYGLSLVHFCRAAHCTEYSARRTARIL